MIVNVSLAARSLCSPAASVLSPAAQAQMIVNESLAAGSLRSPAAITLIASFAGFSDHYLRRQTIDSAP
jgi:hypothetical protein